MAAAPAGSHNPENPPIDCAGGTLEPNTESIGCSFETPGEVDEQLFYVFADTGQPERFRLIGRSLTPGLDLQIEILDPQGQLRASGSCQGGSVPCALEVEALLSPDPKPHRARVSEVGGDETGAYHLRLEWIPPLFLQGELISQDVNIFNDFSLIDPAADLDQYQFEAIAGEQLQLEVEGFDYGFDPHLEVFAPDTAELLDVSCEAGSVPGAGMCAVAPSFVVPRTGTYTFVISDAGNDEGGGVGPPGPDIVGGRYDLRFTRLPEAGSAAACCALFTLAALALRRSGASGSSGDS